MTTENNSTNTQLDVSKLRVAIVQSEYHGEYTGSMERHCRQTLVDQGMSNELVETFVVPGTWEIPLATKLLAKKKVYDAIVVFGVVLKGETWHFESIVEETSRAFMDIGLEFEVPVVFEVLSVFDLEQAKARSSEDDKNRGIEAAMAALKLNETISLIK